MFEREAEDYSIDTYETCIYDNLPYMNDSRAREESFRDGATFGYNKANEWHFVKDGEYPTHSNRVLVFTDEGVGFGIYGLDNKKWYTYDTGFDVIAWKEITLPALPNEVKEK